MTIYDQFPAGSPPSLSPPTSAPHTHKQHHDDSDLSSVSSLEDDFDDFDGPLLWNSTDNDSQAAEAGLQSYQTFLREQLSPKGGVAYRHGSLPVKRAKKEREEKVRFSKMGEEGKKDHTRIVVEMSGSHDDIGRVEFCFWSMNGCTCQCGRCN